jgi:glyoxylase-like metal-dependent hydrolase (beta-lactamase superfamily II)
VDELMKSGALALDVLRAQTLVAALSAANSTDRIASVATHADFAVKHTGFCLGESCHGGATEFPYLIATSSFGYVQGRGLVRRSVKVVRLPGIHHDGNVVLISGTLGHVLVDAGTSWYQQLQVERLEGQLDGSSIDRILLTSRRYPVSGGAKHISDAFGGIPIHIHSDGQAALERGDFFTTWANRYDSDMPPTLTQSVSDGEVFPLGKGEVQAVALPGHTSDGMGYHIPHLSTMIVGSLLPRADRPTRWDLPSGSLMDVIQSLSALKRLKLSSLVPLQGPAIRGHSHIQEVLDRHLAFFEEAALNDGKPPKSWQRPAPTAMWYTPISPWPLDEHERV